MAQAAWRNPAPRRRREDDETATRALIRPINKRRAKYAVYAGVAEEVDVALLGLFHENLSAGLPELPPVPEPTISLAISRNGEGITINQYNQAHDVEDLIRFYGARPTRRRGLYFCPFHPDEHASLSVYTYRGQRYCGCFSAHSNCPLATHRRNDAFNVYCIGEGIDAKVALRQLNNR